MTLNSYLSIQGKCNDNVQLTSWASLKNSPPICFIVGCVEFYLFSFNLSPCFYSRSGIINGISLHYKMETVSIEYCLIKKNLAMIYIQQFISVATYLNNSFILNKKYLRHLCLYGLVLPFSFCNQVFQPDYKIMTARSSTGYLLWWCTCWLVPGTRYYGTGTASTGTASTGASTGTASTGASTGTASIGAASTGAT